MGNAICYFVDTDLHNLTPEIFHRTLEKRCKSKIILKGSWDSPYAKNIDDDSSEWSYWCDRMNFDSAVEYGGLELYRNGAKVSLELGYWKNTFDIDSLYVGGKELFLTNDKFFNFISFLSQDTQEILHDLKMYIDAVKKYVQPILNCHRLFICGDQVYDPDRQPWQAHLLEGMSIDEALRLNSSLPKPEPVFTWNNLEKLMEHDIDDSAIFVFDLDHLPNYLK